MRIVETDRIYLREFNSEDVKFLYRLNQDEDVLQYTGDVPFKNTKEAESFVANYNYNTYQMGRWAVCSIKQGEFLGWCGLKYHPDKDLIEVGYRFFKKHWNKGYATEATKAAITYGFNSLRLPTIHAYINGLNTASIRVAQKAGLTLKEEIIHEGNPTHVFHIHNQFIQVKEINASETYPVRQEMLRKGKPISDCIFDGDELETSFHLGLFYAGNLAGIASFMKNSLSEFTLENQYQLRGMAILHQFQDKKLGNVILREAERILIKKDCQLLWCNARERAVNFYKRNGFETIGTSFDIPNIGVHFKMYRELKKEVCRFF